MTGYYQSKVTIADAGNFTNGQVFPTDASRPDVARSLALQIISAWKEMGRIQDFQIVEMGAGFGTLACNILTKIRDFEP